MIWKIIILCLICLLVGLVVGRVSSIDQSKRRIDRDALMNADARMDTLLRKFNAEMETRFDAAGYTRFDPAKVPDTTRLRVCGDNGDCEIVTHGELKRLCSAGTPHRNWSCQ